MAFAITENCPINVLVVQCIFHDTQKVLAIFPLIWDLVRTEIMQFKAHSEFVKKKMRFKKIREKIAYDSPSSRKIYLHILRLNMIRL